MNRFLAVFLVTVSAGCVVALAFFVSRGEGEDPALYATVAEVRSVAERLDALEVGLGRIEDDLAEIRGLAAAASSRPVDRRASSPSGEVTEEPIEARIERLESAMSTALPILPDEELADLVEPSKHRIKTLLDEVREEEREEERRRRAEREERMIRDRVEEMAERLRLDGGQVDAMGDILVAESERRREIFGSRFGGDDTDDDGKSMWDRMRESREIRNADLGKVLDTWQMEEYEKIENERNRRRGGPRSSGGGGGDDGGRRRGR